MPDLNNLPSASSSLKMNGHPSPLSELDHALSAEGERQFLAALERPAVTVNGVSVVRPANGMKGANGTQATNGKTGTNGTGSKLQPIPAPVAPPPAEERHENPHLIPPRGRSLQMQIRFFRSLFFAARLFASVLFWYYLMPKVIGREAVDRGSTGRWVNYARQFRGFAIAMGGVMIKLGQFVSTRVDALPPEITDALADLQDEVPAVSQDKIRAAIQRELGAVETRFRWLADEPIAAASLGQVYRGQLHNGDRVVLKVQRPGIREVVYTDMAALRIVAHIANRFRFINRRANMNALADEFGRVLLEEVSYRHEARNAQRFAAMFADDSGVYIPTIYTEHSTDSILVIEDVTSIKITDFEALQAAGISRGAVARRLLDTYFKQIFEDRFFHADPHPGNLFVYPLPQENGSRAYGKEGRPFYLIFIDFGMTGSLTPKLASGLINTLTAVVTRDSEKLVKSYAELGFLLPDADTERIEEATKAAFDQVWGLSMTDIKNVGFNEARELGQEFNDLIYAMPFQVPQDFIYLGRAVGILSGMATNLDPAFNPWHEMQPYVQKMMAQGLRAGAASGELDGVMGLPIIQSLFNGNPAQILAEVGKMFINRTVTVPQQFDSVLARLDRGEMTMKVTPTPTYRKQLQRIESQSRRTTRAVITGSVLVSATLLHTNGDTGIAAIGYLFSAVMVVSLWWGTE